MSLLKQFSSSARLAEEGMEFQLTDTGWITLRRGDAKPVRKLREELEKPYRVTLRNGGKIPEEALRKILVTVAAQALVIGWRGDDWEQDGKVIEFSPEKALELFSNPDLEPLVTRCYELSSDFQNFREEDVKKTTGN
jgi:hypothetical protein